MGKEESNKLWENYQNNRNIQNRNILVEHYCYLVKSEADKIAKNLRPAWTRDDIRSPGYDGLIQAVENYDEKKKVKFETYAKFRIRGAIQDWQREIDPLGRQTRTLKKQYQKEIEKVFTSTGLKPTINELIEILNKPESKIVKELQFFQFDEAVVSIDDQLNSFSENDVDIDIEDKKSKNNINIESQFYEEVIKLKFNEEEYNMLIMRIKENKSYSEIGTKIGRSYAWVCSRIPKLLNKLEEDFRQ